MLNPKYQISQLILKYISNIEASRAIVENSPLLPIYERQFTSDAILRRVHYSTAIEGNYLGLLDVKKMIDTPNVEETAKSLDGYVKAGNDINGQEIIARHRDIHEVINYRDAVRYIEDLVKKVNDEDKTFKLTEDIVFELHRILMKNILNSGDHNEADNKAGVYRDKTAVSINFLTGNKAYLYEGAQNVSVKVKELIEWFNTDTSSHPILKAGLLHLEMVRIHPFIEGNGRIARSLATLALTANKYMVNQFFCLDEYYDHNAKDYYEALQKGFKDETDWLEYFSLGMAIEYGRVKDRVLKISKDAKLKERTGQLFISDRQEEIIEWISNYGFIRNQDFEVLFSNISEDTVLREIKDLIDAKVLVKVGKTKSSRYEFAKD